MTTLDMQKEKQTPDRTLASILRQSQKRHTVYERCDSKGEEAKSQRPTESRADYLEWEFCVRRYFDYVETQNKAVLQQQQAHAVQLARRGSEPCLAVMAPLRPEDRPMAGPSSFSYSSYRRGEALNSESRMKRLSVEGDPYNAIYTRSRRGSTASNISNSTGPSRTNSFTSSHGGSPIVSTSAIGFPKSVPSTSYNWTQHAEQPLAHPRATGGDTLEQAWNDIMNATRDMSVNEARAYTQGRLEGLNPALTAQLRNMGGESPPNNPTPPLRQNSTPLSSGQLKIPSTPHELMDTSEEMPLDLQQRRSQILRVANPEKEQSPVPEAVRANTLPVHAQRRLSRRSSKNRLSSLRSDHQRQLSTIVERPMTAGSKKSKAESTKSRKSIFSLQKEKIPPVPKIPRINHENRKPSDSSLSDSSTLRGSTPEKTPRIVELSNSPERPSSRPVTQKSSLSNKRSSVEKPQVYKRSNLSLKPLPMRPDQFPLSSIKQPVEHSDSPMKKFSRFFSWGQSKLNKNSPRASRQASLTSMSSPQLANAMRSAETLQLGNLDAISRRNGSKSTLCLVAIQEGPDQPFSVWLNALPYIEGRCPTPKG
jgi:hypothetical protein